MDFLDTCPNGDPVSITSSADLWIDIRRITDSFDAEISLTDGLLFNKDTSEDNPNGDKWHVPNTATRYSDWDLNYEVTYSIGFKSEASGERISAPVNKTFDLEYIRNCNVDFVDPDGMVAEYKYEF